MWTFIQLTQAILHAQIRQMSSTLCSIVMLSVPRTFYTNDTNCIKDMISATAKDRPLTWKLSSIFFIEPPLNKEHFVCVD